MNLRFERYIYTCLIYIRANASTEYTDKNANIYFKNDQIKAAMLTFHSQIVQAKVVCNEERIRANKIAYIKAFSPKLLGYLDYQT
jgi:hypothetical protein